MLEILQVRKWLEMAAISEVIQQITDSEIRQIEVVLDRWEQKAAAHEATTDEDRTFHRLLYSPFQNQTLTALIDTFFVVYHTARGSLVPADQYPATTVSDHRAILNAVRRKDESLTRQLLREHFRNIQSRLEKAVRSLQPAPQPPAQPSELDLIQPV